MDGEWVESILGAPLFRPPDSRAASSPTIKRKRVQSSSPPREGDQFSDRDSLPKNDPSKEKTNHSSSDSQRPGKGKGIKRGFSSDRQGRTDGKVSPFG